MPLSVPLLLVPGEPDRHYTVHLHRVRWDADAVSGPLTADHLALLEADARQGLRLVAECVAAELADADVHVAQYPDGSAEAVARVLCTEDECAAVADRYRRDADEDIEAEAARTWAATQLQDQTVELLNLRGELEKTTPGKTAADLLAAALAAQQERTGGSTDHVVLLLDEAAYLARESGLLPDGTPEGAREQIERMIRQGRKPHPVESDEAFVGETGRGKTRFEPHRLTDLDSADDLTTWVAPARGSMPLTLTTNETLDYLGRQNPTELTPEHLVRETQELARSVAAGEVPRAGVMRLGELCREVARRCDAEPNPPLPADGEQDEAPGLALALMHRIGYRPRAVRAGEVRVAREYARRDWPLRTLPDTLPDDDAAAVLVYREPTPGLALLEHIRTGDDEGVRGDLSLLLRWLTADGK
ncbi:hypothetical protein [Streptomyces sp. NBC_00212]|uniref:hypothetical protein n=1 Tax=Streptomyces sp. NBC_00212 TaxID=2975684 RepID=UPI002F916343